MAKRDPHDVLGIRRGTSPAQIKAAWRRLARSHHPDLTGDDPAASRVATRKMAEINEAYASLMREARRDGTFDDDTTAEGAPFADGTRRRSGGPPRPKPTRPVTGRVDTSATFRPRNQVSPRGSGHGVLPGQPPLRVAASDPEAPRASTPTGPTIRGRNRRYRRPKPPTLERAGDYTLEFGKFHGHTLREVAAFEPSYVDWLAGTTVMRDPDLVAAARVVQADLDQRGVARRPRPIAR